MTNPCIQVNTVALIEEGADVSFSKDVKSVADSYVIE